MLRIIKKATLSFLIFNIIIIYASPVYAALYIPKQRFGVNTYICSRMDRQDIDTLEKQVGVGWQMNWNLSQWEKYGAAYSIEHTPLVGVWPLYNHFNSYANFKTAVMNELAESPDSFPDGTTWIIGNEIGYTPDFEYYEPAKYVDRFDQYYDYITRLGQELNRGFKFAIGSVFPLSNFHHGNRTGNQYIRQVLEIYKARHGEKMPVDAFTIDPYNFPPFSPTNFNQLKKQVISFRQVLFDMGYRDKEVWIKEWGNLWHDVGYPPTSVQDGADYLDKSVNWFMTATSDTIGMPQDDNRLVQRWSWFYYNDLDRAWSCGIPSGGTYAKMYDSSTNQLNAIGRKYKELIQKYVGNGLPYPTPTDISPITSTPAPTNTPMLIPTNSPTPTTNPSDSPTPTPQPLQGDVNEDEKVDLTDYFYLISALSHGRIPPSVNPDVNGDGTVNQEDRTIIVNILKGEN